MFQGLGLELKGLKNLYVQCSLNQKLDIFLNIKYCLPLDGVCGGLNTVVIGWAGFTVVSKVVWAGFCVVSKVVWAGFTVVVIVVWTVWKRFVNAVWAGLKMVVVWIGFKAVVVCGWGGLNEFVIGSWGEFCKFVQSIPIWFNQSHLKHIEKNWFLR